MSHGEHGPHCRVDAARACANCYELLHIITQPVGVGVNGTNGKHAPEPVTHSANDRMPAEPPRVNEAVDDPNRLARLFIRQRQTHPTGPRLLVRHREEWLLWRESGYTPIGEDELRGSVHECVKAEFDRLNREAIERWEGEQGEKKSRPTAIKTCRGTITNVLDSLHAITLIPSSIEPPAWINERAGPRNLVAVLNGLLDLDALAAGSLNPLLAASPEWFTVTGRPFEYDPRARSQQWETILRENLEGDAQRIAIVQEWFGLNQVADTSYHKFLGLHGEGANGKSVLCGALEASVGRSNCSFVPLELFAERFQLTATVGRLANIAAECSEADKTAEAILKGFVSGDPMLFDRKNKTPLQCRPTARLTFAMNNRPRFTDRSGGLWRRMILMPMRVIVPEGRRIKGMDAAEYWAHQDRAPGLFNWALQGLLRLRRQGRFTESDVCNAALGEYRLESNPARQFLDEKCREDGDASTTSSVLYDCYRRWCTANGYSPLSNGKFGGEVFRAFPKARKGQVGKVWSYCGVAFDQFLD